MIYVSLILINQCAKEVYIEMILIDLVEKI